MLGERVLQVWNMVITCIGSVEVIGEIENE